MLRQFIGGPLDGVSIDIGSERYALYFECDGKNDYSGSAIYLTPPSLGGIKYALKQGHYFFAGYTPRKTE